MDRDEAMAMRDMIFPKTGVSTPNHDDISPLDNDISKIDSQDKQVDNDSLNQTICDRCGVPGHRRLNCPQIEEEKERKKEGDIEKINNEINNSKD